MAGKLVKYVHYHKDGSVWAKGQTRDGKMTGYWEWFRKSAGTIMRSGHFDNGEQVGEWITYNQAGAVHKVTQMKPRAKARAKAKPKPKAKATSTARKRTPISR